MEAILYGLGVGAKGAVVQGCVCGCEHEMIVSHGPSKDGKGDECICHVAPIGDCESHKRPKTVITQRYTSTYTGLMVKSEENPGDGILIYNLVKKKLNPSVYARVD